MTHRTTSCTHPSVIHSRGGRRLHVQSVIVTPNGGSYDSSALSMLFIHKNNAYAAAGAVYRSDALEEVNQ